MKHLKLFEGFRDDIIKNIQDIKKTYDDKVNDYKEKYKNELIYCVTDLEDNYNIIRSEGVDDISYLTNFTYLIYVELEKMDNFFEDILSTGNKIINHLNSEISVQFFYLKPNDDLDIDEVSVDNMPDLEIFIKNARRQFRNEMEKSNLWNIVSDKPMKSPSYDDINHEPDKYGNVSHPFMIYAEICVGG